MKVLILAPNAGVSLSSGGGTNFVLKQARALAGLGHSVTLAGFHALPLPELVRMHGVSFEGLESRVRVHSGPGSWEYRAQRQLPGKPSPYFALLDPRVRSWLRGLGDRERPDAVWFHDDIPRAALDWTRSVRSFLYVHYPLAARTASIAPPLRRSRGRTEAAQDAVLRRLRSRIIVPDPVELCESVQTNSRVTQRACRALWGSEPVVWPTYVDLPGPEVGRRGPSVVSVAAFHRGKGLETVIEGFCRSTVPDARLTLFGHARDAAHLVRLHRLATERGRGAQVGFVPDASRDQVIAAWKSAQAVISGAEFEPFGLSLLEGMSYGAPGIVRSSAWSGAWTDVLEEGRYGDGFGSVEELGAVLDQRLGLSSSEAAANARARASAFSEARFVDGLRKVLPE